MVKVDDGVRVSRGEYEGDAPTTLNGDIAARVESAPRSRVGTTGSRARRHTRNLAWHTRADPLLARLQFFRNVFEVDAGLSGHGRFPKLKRTAGDVEHHRLLESSALLLSSS